MAERLKQQTEGPATLFCVVFELAEVKLDCDFCKERLSSECSLCVCVFLKGNQSAANCNFGFGGKSELLFKYLQLFSSTYSRA